MWCQRSDFLRGWGTPAVLLSALVLNQMLQTAVYAQSGSGERAAIEIVTVTHRDPGLIRQQIAPMLDPRGHIGQMDNKLIIASTADNLAQLRQLITDADTPARRLVVSVDFAHDPDVFSPDTTRQYSLQAIEGDELLITDDLALPGTATSVSILADIRDQYADISFELDNLPGFTGRHVATLPLGIWYVINPADLDDDDEDGSEAQIALRVDVLP